MGVICSRSITFISKYPRTNSYYVTSDKKLPEFFSDFEEVIEDRSFYKKLTKEKFCKICGNMNNCKYSNKNQTKIFIPSKNIKF